MKESKLYSILSSFSTKQLNRFDKFVKSPYFNSNDSLIKLYELIHGILKGNKEIEEKAAWEAIFREKDYHEGKFRKLLSDLVSLTESFLIQEELNDSSLLKQNLLLQSIKKNKISAIQKKIVTNSIKEADRRKEQSSEYFLQRFRIEKNHYNLTSHFERKAKKKSITAAQDLQELSKKLDIFYLIEKMRHGTDLLTWSVMYKSDIDFAQFDFTSKLIERSNYLEIPAVNIFYNIFKAFKDDQNPKHYFKAKEIMLNNLDEFPFAEQQDIYDSMISYCIGKVNDGEKEFIPEALEMYKTGVDTGISLIDGELTPTTFRNIVGVSLRFGYIDTAIDFINDKIDLINHKFRNNALNFNLARVYFYKKDHGKVLDYLNQVDFDDVWYNINSKAMLIATYYETEELDPLESLLTSYAAFIRREKSLDESRRHHFLNFVKIVRKLIKVFPVTNEKLDKLKDEVQNTKAIINRKWLYERIELLRP